MAYLIQYKPLTYETTYVYPVWADACGWLIVASIILCVPVFAIKRCMNSNGTPLMVSLSVLENGFDKSKHLVN